ncbi:uncharacterized protein LOC126266493 [Aethina tumida]|uniref:uncharacterized protein LOC126266493 n=1 Tax=Aethina tumida TaxID=116153 RepID=UPI002148C973|nr:uncharacterized protein LOC126266493 [Aethina tumida]
MKHSNIAVSVTHVQPHVSRFFTLITHSVAEFGLQFGRVMSSVCCLCCTVTGNLARRLLYKFIITTNSLCLGCKQQPRLIGEDSDTETELREEYTLNVDRETAEELLKDRQNGTFIVRPSKDSSSTMSIVQDGQVFHLKVRDRKDGLVALGFEKDNEVTFKNLNSLIDYYVSNNLYLTSDGKIYKTLLLPYTNNSSYMVD